jgi:hypothetical protein
MSLALSRDQASRLLGGAGLVAAARTGLGQAREIEAACLAAGVPAVLGKQPHAPSTRLPKHTVLCRPGDMERVQGILRQRWLEAITAVDERHAALLELGLSPGRAETPCPACGSTATLEDGACPECGLVLA